MKRKGFTLIELLAVIVVLAIIALIAIPLVLNSIEESKKGAKVNSAYSFIRNLELEIASSMIEDNQSSIIGTNSLAELKEKGLNITLKGENPIEGSVCMYDDNKIAEAKLKYKDNKIIHYANDKAILIEDEDMSLDNCNTLAYFNTIEMSIANQTLDNKKRYVLADLSGITSEALSISKINACSDNGKITEASIEYSNGKKYKYNGSKLTEVEKFEELLCGAYPNGYAVYFDPVNGAKCETYTTSNSNQGVKTGCLKWYAINDEIEAETVNLIADHNVGTFNYSKYSTSYKIDQTKVNNALIPGWDNTFNPRLITGDEIKQITGKSAFSLTSSSDENYYYLDSNSKTQISSSSNKSPYAWLFDYLVGCQNYGCNHTISSGNSLYWTSNSVRGSSTYGVYVIFRDGALKYYGANTGIGGYRPVITVPKSLLK